MYIAHIPELVPIDITLLKDILVKDYSFFSSHGVFYHEKNVLTPHLFNIEGQIWKDRRTKLTPLFTSEVVNETIQYRENNNVQRNDFMQLMLQLKQEGSLVKEDGPVDVKKTGAYITDKEILSESFLIFLAGHETSSSTSTFALFALAQNPDIQEKLRAEIYEVLERHDEKLGYDETLRKYPVAQIIPRRCTKDYKIKDTNIVIEKGTRIYIPVIGVHLDPEYYPDPERFDPEKFTPENKATRPDIAWMPFGAGPRQCLGMRFGLLQTKVALASLLQKFKFTLNKVMKASYTADPSTFVYMFKQDVLLDATTVN
ncbi:hypothetical protein HUJ04_011117 [Dendroctonus ponderosae]|nr:hypothetical protein HUJ04_011117 [Dendroctonus ponderosae]